MINNRVITEFSGPYRFLSNFWPCSFFYAGATWPSSEHCFQAMKTMDTAERNRVLLCSTPGQAKREGQRVTMRPEWDRIRKQAMLQVVLAKFSQNTGIAGQLVETEDLLLVEGNTWHDNYWGSCRCGTCSAGAEIQWLGTGKNYLGRTLMFVRDMLVAD